MACSKVYNEFQSEFEQFGMLYFVYKPGMFCETIKSEAALILSMSITAYIIFIVKSLAF